MTDNDPRPDTPPDQAITGGVHPPEPEPEEATESATEASHPAVPEGADDPDDAAGEPVEGLVDVDSILGPPTDAEQDQDADA